MKKLLLSLLTLLSLYTSAQDIIEAPLDTLTRSVTALQQALEVKNRIRLSGYVQGQFQDAQSTGIATFAGGNFLTGVDKRFMVRRGRIKVEYTGPFNDRGISVNNLLIQTDWTEKGVRLIEAYARFTDPYIGWFNLTIGLQNRPFGYEIGYSSSLRESPERGRMSQLIFPNERDLGAIITFQAPKISRWNWFKIDAGMFNGNATPGAGQDVSDFDKKKDFIGHISFNKSNLEETFKYGGGISYYNGGFRIDSIDVYSMSHEPATDVTSFHLDSKKIDNYNKGLVDTRHFTKREYRGVDLQLVKIWSPGMTILRAEYIWGTQPGIKTDDSPGTDTRSPITSTPITKDVYNRKFSGAYFYFVQNIMQSPFQFVVKYDWYDPNVEVKGNDIGRTVSTGGYAATSASDIRYDTWGVGLIIHMDAGIKLMTYYDIVKNETSDKLTKYSSDKKDNVLTVRLQATF